MSSLGRIAGGSISNLSSLTGLSSAMPLHQILTPIIQQGLSLIGQYRLSDASRPLRLRMSGTANQKQIDDVLLIKEARGEWHLNKGIKLELTCLAAHAALPLTPFIGQQVAFDSVTDQGELFSLTGIVTAVTAGESDGALAIYTLTIEDSFSLLKKRRNSRVFLDQSILDITYILFNEWLEKNEVFKTSLVLDTSKLNSNFPKFSFTMQSGESDFDFLTRLWRKAGLSFWIEPEEAYSSGSQFSTGGSLKQRLMLVDGNDAIEQSATGALRYHRADGTEPRDTITAFSGVRQLVPSGTQSQQWQVLSSSNQSQTGDIKEASLASLGLVDNRLATAFHPEDEEWLSEQETRQGLSYEAAGKYFSGVSHVRDLHLGRWFTLEEHPELDANHSGADKEFTVLGLDFVAQNNLPQELLSRVNALHAVKAQLLASTVAPGLALNEQQNLKIINHFKAVRRSTPLVTSPDSLLTPAYTTPHVKPMIGVVVGPSNEEVLVDEQYRVQVRFSELSADDHRHQGGRGTNNSEGDSAWIPVLNTLAGHQFGHSFIPRVGQTVVVDFLNGDIDRPFISGVLYDGTHAPAQFNHTGTLPDNRYLSGVVSKEIGTTRTNQLKLDDTNKEISAQLQSEEQQSQLNLGFITHPRNNTAKHRGTGLELRTDGQGAIRANGLLISTHGQSEAKGDVMDAKAAQSQLQSNFEAAKILSELAKNQNSDPLQILDALQTYISNLQHDEEGANQFKEALLVLASPEGISLSTPKDIHLQANEQISLGANQGINLSTQKDLIIQANKKVSLFAGEGGIKAFAGKGEVEVQAQSDNLELIARKTIKIISTEEGIEISAPNEIKFTANGSQLSLNSGGVFIKTGGVFNPKAAQHKVEAGAKANVEVLALPFLSLPQLFSQRIDLSHLNTLFASQNEWSNLPFEVIDSKGALIHSGILNEQGVSNSFYTSNSQEVIIMVGEDGWDIEHEEDRDDLEALDERS